MILTEQTTCFLFLFYSPSSFRNSAGNRKPSRRVGLLRLEVGKLLGELVHHSRLKLLSLSQPDGKAPRTALNRITECTTLSPKGVGEVAIVIQHGVMGYKLTASHEAE